MLRAERTPVYADSPCLATKMHNAKANAEYALILATICITWILRSVSLMQKQLECLFLVIRISLQRNRLCLSETSPLNCLFLGQQVVQTTIASDQGFPGRLWHFVLPPVLPHSHLSPRGDQSPAESQPDLTGGIHQAPAQSMFWNERVSEWKALIRRLS